MLDFLILYKSFGHETGVSVSVHHLEALLKKENMKFAVLSYKDDNELLNIIRDIESKVIILQAPTFSYQTLLEILKYGREINLVIHSTISFLQVEEEAFEKVQKILAIKDRKFSISNPCQYEVEGFRAYAGCDVFYLPNTFNNEIDNIEKILFERVENHADEKLRVGLFCAYRPFKNIMTQLTACVLLQNKMGIPVEVNMFRPIQSNPIYRSVLQLINNTNLCVKFHEQCSNRDFYKILQEIDVGMQVSYSETFSYVICEHMMFGTPTVSSTTVPFANKIVEFNNAVSIANGMLELCENKEIYRQNAKKAISLIAEVQRHNNNEVVKTLSELLKRSNND